MKPAQATAPPAHLARSRTPQRTAQPKQKPPHRPRRGPQESSFAALLAENVELSSRDKKATPRSLDTGNEPTLDRDSQAEAAPHDLTATEAPFLSHHMASPAELLFTPQTFASASTPTTAPEANWSAMFEHFVSQVRVGKQGDLCCVSLTLDLGGHAPVEVIIEETAMGPTVELHSDNPAEAFALERELKRGGTKAPR